MRRQQRRSTSAHRGTRRNCASVDTRALPQPPFEPLEQRTLFTVFGPLLTFPDWNQNGPIPGNPSVQWNEFTPIDPSTGQHSDVGCVATAIGQIASYWHFPQNLTIPADTTISVLGQQIPLGALANMQIPGLGSLNDALSNLEYDGSPTEEALLSFAIGALVGSNYSSAETIASPWSGSLGALGFEAASDSHDWDDVKDTVAANIEAGEPALLIIAAPGQLTTHIVVADGYDDLSGMYHLRYGWGGLADGWYLPPNLGAGYTQVTQVIYNINPALDAPTGINASAAGKGVHLAWNPVPNATTYQVWRSTSDHPDSAVRIDKQLASNGIAATSFDDTTAAGGKTYYYWVRSESGPGTAGSDFGEAAIVAQLPTHLAITQLPGTGTAGRPLGPVVVQLLDAKNRVVVTDSSAVTLSLWLGGTLSGTMTVQAVNGVATFDDLSITAAGTYTLAATDGSLPPAKPRKITIAPDAGSSQLVLGPSPAASGEGGPVVLLAVDRFGNLLKNERSLVTLAVVDGPPGAALVGTTTVRLRNGIAQFNNLGFAAAGLYTLSADDPGLSMVLPLQWQKAVDAVSVGTKRHP